MNSEQENKISVLDIFTQSQETFDEAKKKSSDESGNRAKHLRLSKDGTIAVRILPLAPVIGEDGQPVLPMERKGYEYPVKELLLKITDSKKEVKGKPATTFVNVCNAKYAFPKLKSDLIDLYVSRACELYADDEELCKKLKESSFNGGLKWDSKRSMYVFDVEKRKDGLQILQLSYSQYKDLEDRKMHLWTKLMKNGSRVPCPISSIEDAYPLEITRKTEKKKTEYSFNIDLTSGKDELSPEELSVLLENPRLPDVLYRYTRFHLEATVVFLMQFDEIMGIKIMEDAEIIDCIDQIKMLLPADDHSHFVLGGKNNETGESATEESGIDALWATFNKLKKKGLDDKSDEGQDLRTSIREFVEENEMNIRLGRGKTNLDLLEEIDGILTEDRKEEETPAEETEEKGASRSRRNVPASTPEPEEEEEEEPAQPEHRGRNDDTNEPAARSEERRSARPVRRR
ncbi:MAG: hypothetical protein LBI60_02645 [Bacteroidales bacterium]|jgi:hypothetical protein|nr:hypothetical protein [Bacteroidales bacterium]